MIVVDASVAVKWFLPEADSDAAARLLEGGQKLVAPELIRIEVAAALTRRGRLGELTDSQVRATTEAWSDALADGVVILEENGTDLPRAIELALALRHPVQDCLYLALAGRLDVPLVTADRAFGARATSIDANVTLLAEA
jgi:hypothetical protein